MARKRNPNATPRTPKTLTAESLLIANYQRRIGVTLQALKKLELHASQLAVLDRAVQTLESAVKPRTAKTAKAQAQAATAVVP